MTRLILRFASLAAALCALPLQAQTGVVSGDLTDDSGRPLVRARVLIVGTQLATESRADGSFELREVPVGTQTVRAQRIGNRVAMQRVAVRAGEVTTVRLVLAADALAMDAVVVSGTFNPASKLESSTAITTLSPVEVQQRAPRGTAELLKGVPGFQVMSNSGETGADVTVRGLPQTANSSFRYISLQEDGLPAFEPAGLLFAFPDAMARLDESVARVEALRGGSAAVFGSGTPGGIVNLISKTGGPTLGGTLRTSAGSQGMGRLDLNVGGPIAGSWRFNAGGYYRYDRGVRDPGFAANNGGQVRVNLTRDYTRGHVRFYGKYLNEHNVWYLGIPIVNYRNPEAVPGGPEIGAGTNYASERLRLTVPDAFNPGTSITRDMNGNTTRYRMLGVDLLHEFPNGVSLTFRGKALAADNITNLMIDVADPVPIATFGPPAPKQVRYVTTGEIVSDPASVAALNGNGLMSVRGLAFVNQPVRNGIANIELAKQAGQHALTAGVYYSDYTTRLELLQQGIFLEVADNPRMIQVGVAGMGGAFTGVTPGDGFAAYNSGFYNLRNHARIGAFYIGDQWRASDRLTLDGGARVDRNWSVGRNERPVIPGTVTSGQTTGQSVPAGYPAFTPTAAQSRAGLFGSGIYRTWDYTFDTWSASLGANYRLGERSALYGRASRGSRIPTSQQWTFQTSNGSQVTGETNRGAVETTVQAELGVKTSGTRWSLLATGFYGGSKNLITVLQRGQPNGTFAFLPISADTRTFGMELEGTVSPISGLQLRTVTTIQDPRFTRFRYEFFVPGSNPGSGTQVRDYSGKRLNDAVTLLTDLSASYTHGRGELFGTFRYTGDRAANRPNTVTIPGYGEVNGGVSVRVLRAARVVLQGLNLFNTQAIVQMAARTGEDILRVLPDGTAESLVTTGAAAGTTTQSRYTTGLGILPRTLHLSVTYDF